MQLIIKMKNIWKSAGLILWVRSYEIIVISSDSGLIEFIPDTVSIDALKKKIGPDKTLLEFYQSTFQFE